jgi:hypothetical protein
MSEARGLLGNIKRMLRVGLRLRWLIANYLASALLVDGPLRAGYSIVFLALAPIMD